jgi:5-methylthioribose kinase
LRYVEDTIKEIIQLFGDKFLQLWDEKATERTASYPGFKESYLDSILEDTVAVTGLELCRRIIGLAKVKDITSIANANDRVLAEKICLTAGKTFILERSKIRTSDDFIKVLNQSVQQFSLVKE